MAFQESLRKSESNFFSKIDKSDKKSKLIKLFIRNFHLIFKTFQLLKIEEKKKNNEEKLKTVRDNEKERKKKTVEEFKKKVQLLEKK